MDSATITPQLSPTSLARAFDCFVSARWRGDDEAADTFASWFEAHWTGDAPPEPTDPPEAASILGGAGSGIRWYARDDVVLGYVSGRGGGCYLVSANEVAPPLASTRPAPPAQPDLIDQLVETGFIAPDHRVMETTDQQSGARWRTPATGSASG